MAALPRNKVVESKSEILKKFENKIKKGGFIKFRKGKEK